MATLYDMIKATSGLLAYWPLIDNADHSGNNRHLESHGSVQYGQATLTNDLRPSIVTPVQGGTLRINQASIPKIRAVEGMFRFTGAKGNGAYSSLISFNNPISGSANRAGLVYQDVDGVYCFHTITPPGAQVSKSVMNTWDKLSQGAHHFVIQLNDAGTETEVYIDGVKDSDMTLGIDVFLQLQNTYLAIGVFYFNGIPNGSCSNSDVAVYNRPLTQGEITNRQGYRIGDPIFKSVRLTAVAANQEPRSQFQPQDVAWRGTPPLYPGPVNLQQQTQTPLCKGRDCYWIRDGVQNVLQGYIESTVTISGVGVRRRVLCFTQDGELVGETYSRAADGVYRFDLLWLNKRYMLVAQDDPAFGPADYNAVAADYQAPKPYPPGGGVAPAPFPMLAPLKRK